MPRYRAAVPAQRDIDIVSKPPAQGDVPPAPEVRDPGSTVWMVKVLTQFETKESAKANCHIGIAGKVKIQLQ